MKPVPGSDAGNLGSAVTCEQFNELPWHDSQLIGIEIKVVNDSERVNQHDVLLHVLLLSGVAEYQGALVTVRDCRMARASLDLVGKALCGHAIADAT